jgi:hypothetical protein
LLNLLQVLSRILSFFDIEEMVPTDQPIVADPSANPSGDPPALVASDQARIRSTLDSVEIAVFNNFVPGLALRQLGAVGSSADSGESQPLQLQDSRVFVAADLATIVGVPEEQGLSVSCGSISQHVHNPVTRLQHNIKKPKLYTNGMIRYVHLAVSSSV